MISSLSSAPFVAFLVTWVALSILLYRWSDRILDHPNERSLHRQPVPRTGGIGVVLGLAIAFAFLSPTGWWPLWLGASILVVISFLDDLIGLPIIVRLIVHFIAAGVCMIGLVVDHEGLGWVFVGIVVIVWMTNLFNFMDGMDGLAGGMALFGFGFLSIAAWLSGNATLALVCVSITSATGAFLLFNFPPARIFLGDVGSTTLGFLAAGIGLLGWRDGAWSLWFPGLVFSPFVVDATVTLLRRACQGERFWEAHRSHFYQRLALSGWGHRKTVLAEYVLMMICGIFGLLYQISADRFRLTIVAVCVLAFLGLAKAVRVVEHAVDKERAGSHAR